MRICLKWIGIVLFIPILLIAVVSILLYIPPVQNYVLQKATRYASVVSGMDIGVERIRLSFPLDVSVSGVCVVSPPTDTLLVLQDLSVRVNPLPLMSKIVSVDKLSVTDARVNTGSFIEGMAIKGTLGNLYAQADHISLTDEKATLNHLKLSDAAFTLLIDTVAQSDTTTSMPLHWVLNLERISLEHICIALQMPMENDSLRLRTYIGEAGLSEGVVDLGISRYMAQRFSLSETDIHYDGDGNAPSQGLDPLHIALDQLHIAIESILYQDKEINAGIKEFSAKERSGLTITSLKGDIHSDTLAVYIPELILTTSESEIRLLGSMPWSVPDEDSKGNMHALLTASLGKKDLFTFVSGLPAGFVRDYPNTPVNVVAHVGGNLSELNLRQLKAELPGAFVVNASGKAGHVTDSVRRSADIRLQASPRNMNFALTMLPDEQQNRFSIPPSLALSGSVELHDRQVKTKLLLTEDKARIHADACYHMAQASYQAHLKIDSLEPVHFMPLDSMMWISAEIMAEGTGTDIFADETWTDVKGRIDSVCYGATEVSGINLTASLKDHQAQLELSSAHPAMNLDVTLEGSIYKEEVKATLIADIGSIDLYALRLMDTPLSTSLQLFGQAESDWQKTHRADLTIGNWEIRTDSQSYRPKMLALLARTDQDTTRISLHAGDLGIVLTGNAELTGITDKVRIIANEISAQLQQDSTIDIAALRPSFPDMNLVVTAGNDNPIYNLFQQSYMGFSSLRLEASTSPEDGLLMDAHIYTLHHDAFKIDTIQASIRTDSAGLLYRADVYKNRYRQQPPFTAHINGAVQYKYADAYLLYKNDKDSVGLSMGVRVVKDSVGLLVHFFPEEQIIAFNKFTLNPNNYIRFRNMKEIDANVRFSGLKNASLWLHTVDTEEGYPELHAELSQIDLGVVSGGFPQIPAMAGIFSADVRYAPTDEAFLVVLDAYADNLFFRDGRIGELMLNGVYLPLDDGSHQVDAHLSRDEQETATVTAVYRPDDTVNNLDGHVDITALPLSMLSPFVPDNMATLSGMLNSRLLVSGSTSAPKVNGYLQLDSSAVFVNSANSEFRISHDTIKIKNSIMTFNNYTVYAANRNPLTLGGDIDFSNLSRMMADMRLTAGSLQLLDTRRTPESVVYGKVLVDLSATLKGPLDALAVRGDIHLLGGTNATYVLTDSPLAVEDRLDGLVTFTSFADTVFRMRPRQAPLPLGGVDMLMVLHIDPIVRLRVDLTPDQSNYAEVTGGGDLSFQYTPQGDMVLNGRYMFDEGLLNYKLPVIPLKEFHIAQGSYIRWDGEVANPLIHVKATERMRVSAKTVGETSSRMVYFNVGLQINDRLENMQPKFIISAEDGAIENDLASMGTEERSKQAVALMVTGSYLYGGGSGGMNLDVNSALNSFLSSEINNIAGGALKSVDLSFGMDTYEQDGNTKRDFSFQFARRFYNDRIRVVVGGRVSTGGNTQEKESFLDNVSVEYRLDRAGSTNVKLFHDRNYISVLEGEITETGAGVVFRRKMKKLRELFDFRRKKVKPVEEGENERQAIENEQQASDDE
ncbi:MAG: translocation/assembly module TamB domain-containing protein [Tannerellaceae bacterium]|jgi:hypothetical protein|nr:translocation/assembly module TamB domain-containing protein [Tannerellaceae bacterium]